MWPILGILLVGTLITLYEVPSLIFLYFWLRPSITIIRDSKIKKKQQSSMIFEQSFPAIIATYIVSNNIILTLVFRCPRFSIHSF